MFKHASEQGESRRSVTVKEHHLDGRHRRGVATSTTVCRATCSYGNMGHRYPCVDCTRRDLDAAMSYDDGGEEDLGVDGARAHDAVVVCRSGVRAAVVPTANMAKR